jgi:hypothetical protein
MRWNYRLIQNGKVWFLAEVFYMHEKPTGYSEPIIVGDSAEEVLEQLQTMWEDADMPHLIVENGLFIEEN